MAIFNIAEASGYELPSASWVNNDADVRPKPSQHQEGDECENAHFSVDTSCNLIFGDRFAIQGRLRSGSINTVKSNSNDINAGESGLAIRIVEDGSAIRGNDYDAFTNSFTPGLPVSNIYYLPGQIVSTVYSMTTNYYSHRNPTSNIKNNSYQWFLAGNYKDKFNSKNRILIATEIDPILTTRLGKNTYTVQCDGSLGCENCCIGVSASFIQPSGDNDSNYTTYGNLGIAFDVKENTINATNVITNINYSGETIVRLIYDSLYSSSEMSIKHPRINNYLLINLPSVNTTLNLENYQ